jgi:hypothetical protein
MMSKSQTALYWREWAAAKRAGRLDDSDRHRLHIEALGYDKSSTDFTNKDLDKVLSVFRAISRPDDLSAQLRQLDQQKIRILHKCRQLADPAYIARVVLDKFHVHALEELTQAQATMLLFTLTNRARANRRKEAELI